MLLDALDPRYAFAGNVVLMGQRAAKPHGIVGTEAVTSNAAAHKVGGLVDLGLAANPRPGMGKEPAGKDRQGDLRFSQVVSHQKGAERHLPNVPWMLPR